MNKKQSKILKEHLEWNYSLQISQELFDNVLNQFELLDEDY